MRNLLILAILLFTLGSVLSGQAAWADSPAGHEQTETFSIEKMTCAACPITVKKAMQRVDGVKSVGVSFDSKTAVVVFDSATTSAAEIAAASTGIGYPAKVVNKQP